MTSVFSWQNSVSLWSSSFCTPRSSLPITPGISWLPTFALQSPIMKRTFFWVLVLKGLVGLHRTIQFQLFQHYWLGHRLKLLWYWMICLEMNRDHSIVFEIAPKYFISDSFVDYEGYSISSKGFLPTVVDIMIIWIKFAYSCPFKFLRENYFSSNSLWPAKLSINSEGITKSISEMWGSKFLLPK